MVCTCSSGLQRVLFIVVIAVSHHAVSLSQSEAGEYWCGQSSNVTRTPILDVSSVMDEVNERLSGAPDDSFVVVCVSHELSETVPRGLLNAQWSRRLIVEITYVLQSREQPEDTGFLNDISAVRLFAEGRPSDSREWEFDTSYAVRWVPVSTNSSFESIVSQTLLGSSSFIDEQVETGITELLRGRP